MFCSRRAIFTVKYLPQADSAPEDRAMPATARKLQPQPQIKTFHASVLVTRVEEWWVEAASAEEAQALFAAGDAHRSAIGECVHVEVQEILDEAD